MGYQNYNTVGIGRKTTAIKPISDLRNRAKEISRLCHRENRPVFITRNGESDLVVMSQAHYDRLVARLDLYQKLDEAEVQSRPRGSPRAGHRAVMRQLRARLALCLRVESHRARDLDTLVIEATSPAPRRKWWELSADGIKEAAKTLGDIATPVLSTLAKLATFLA